MFERFGAIVRRRRLDRGITLEKVAKAVGSHKGYISGIESGKVRPPRPHYVKAICKLLGLPYEEMELVALAEKAPGSIRDRVRKMVDWELQGRL